MNKAQNECATKADRSLSTEIPSRLMFARDDEFNRTIRSRVDQYFKDAGQGARDRPGMYIKTAVILVWLALSYISLLFFVSTWWWALLLIVSLGLAMAAVGFNIQHDGGHQAYSNHAWINRLMARSLDLLGGSSFFWERKHNHIHHNFANISGHDDDIDLGILGRLSPHQPRLSFHKYQHYYLWLLYGFLPLKWQLYDDFRDLATGQAGGRPCPRPKGWNLVTLLAGKTLFFSLAVVVPLFFHPLWAVVLSYVAASLVQGITLSVVFQLAHCVEEAEFPLPAPNTGRMAIGWAAHQVESTVNFARNNRLLSWYIGGLNFQIEHHLFPRICHLHYAALSPLVEETCQEFGLKYRANATFRAGLSSHFRWLRRMGSSSDTAK